MVINLILSVPIPFEDTTNQPLFSVNMNSVWHLLKTYEVRGLQEQELVA